MRLKATANYNSRYWMPIFAPFVRAPSVLFHVAKQQFKLEGGLRIERPPGLLRSRQNKSHKRHTINSEQ